MKTLVLFGFHLKSKPFHFNDVCFPLQSHLLWSSNAVLSPIRGTTYAIGDHLLLEMMKVSSTSPMLRNFTSIGIKYFFSYQWYSGWSPRKIGIAFFRCGPGGRVSKNLGDLIEYLSINFLIMIWYFNTKHILYQIILTWKPGNDCWFDVKVPFVSWEPLSKHSFGKWVTKFASWLLFVSRYYLCCLLFNFLLLHSLFISVTFRSKKK